MSPVFVALLPVYGLIGLGQILRRGVGGAWRLPPGVWRAAERLCYFGLLPVLIVTALLRIDLASPVIRDLGGVLVATVVIAVAGLVAARPWLARRGLDGPAFTSLFQGTIRPNIFVGLPVAEVLLPGQGAALIFVGLTPILPLVNVLSVWVLSRHGREAVPGWGAVARSLGRNPLILALLTGIALNLAGVTLPAGLAPARAVLAEATIALALILVGGGLDFATLGRQGRPLVLAVVLRLGVMPVLGWGLCRILGLPDLVTAMVVLFNSQPAAAASYILSRQLGGDSGLMAAIITAHVLVAAATLPLVLLLFG